MENPNVLSGVTQHTKKNILPTWNKSCTRFSLVDSGGMDLGGRVAGESRP